MQQLQPITADLDEIDESEALFIASRTKCTPPGHRSVHCSCMNRALKVSDCNVLVPERVPHRIQWSSSSEAPRARPACDPRLDLLTELFHALCNIHPLRQPLGHHHHGIAPPCVSMLCPRTKHTHETSQLMV